MTASTSARCLLALLFLSSFACAQPQELKISFDGGVFAPGSDVSVSVGLLPLKTKLHGNMLPKGYSNPTARYDACTAKDETSKWNTGLGAEAFCSLKDQQTELKQTGAESVQDIANGSAERHTFGDKVSLPVNPVGTKLWVIVRLDYDFPGLAPGVHRSIYGWASLLYRCDPVSSPTERISCAYYTPGGYTAHHVGKQISQPTPKPPPH